MRTKTEIQKTFEHLANEIQEERAVVFVGSGFSLNAVSIPGKNAQMKTWDELKEMVLDQIEVDSEKRKHLNGINTPRLLQIYEQSTSTRRRNEIIKRAIPDADVLPSVLHKELVSINWASVITTNIDTLIERAFRKYAPLRLVTPVIYEHDMTYITGTPIFKVHGDYNNEDTWIFSEKDYNTRIQPLFIDKLRTLFAENTVIFLGYSINDPDLDAVLYFLKDRIRHFQKKAVFVTKDSDDLAEPYWRDRNIELLTASDLKALEGEPDVSQNPCIPTGFKEFYEKFFKTLNDYVKKNPKSRKNRPTWLWKQTNLIPAIREQNAEALKIISDINKKLLRMQGQISDSEFLVKISEFINARDFRSSLEEYFNAILGLTELRKKPEFANNTIAFNEVLYKLEPVAGDDLPIYRALLTGLFIPELESTIEKVFRDFLDSVWNRLDEGYLTGLDANEIDNALGMFQEVLNPQTNSELCKLDWLLCNLRELYWIRLINGQGMDEALLSKAISIQLKIHNAKISPEKRSFLQFRLLVSYIYQNRWSELRKKLNKYKSDPGWQSKWTAFFEFELGNKQVALDIYESNRIQGYTLKERFLAEQSISEIERKDISIWDYYNVDSQAKIQDNFEKLEETKAQAAKTGESLGDFDFSEYRINQFSKKIYEKAMSNIAKEKIIFLDASSEQDTITPMIYSEYLLHALNGIPAVNFQTDALREAFALIFNEPVHLNIILELQAILPIFKDFKNESIEEKTTSLCWQYPEGWKILQNRILKQYSLLIDYIIELGVKKDQINPNRLLKRYYMLTALIDRLSHFLPENSKEKPYNLIVKIIKKWELFYTGSDGTHAEKIKSIIVSIFAKANLKQRYQLLEEGLLDQIFTFEGRIFFSFIQEYLNSDLWELLSPERKILITETLKNTMADHPDYCKPVLFFAQGNPDHELIAIAEKGIDDFINKKSKAAEEEVKRIEKLPDFPEKVTELKNLTQDKDNLLSGEDRFVKGFRSLLEKLKKNENSTNEAIKPLKGFIEKIRSIKPGLDSALTIDGYQLDQLIQYIKEEFTEEETQSLNEYFIELQQEFLNPRGMTFPDWRKPSYDLMIRYYILTNQTDAWFNLCNKFDYFPTVFTHDEQPKEIRLLMESESETIGESIADRIFYFYIGASKTVKNTTEDGRKFSVIRYFSWINKSMTRVLDSDIRILNYYWNDEFARTRFIDFPIMLTLKIMELEPDRISPMLPRFIRLLVNAEIIWLDPHRAAYIAEFLEKTIQFWNTDEALKSKVLKLQEKIKILDFPKTDIINNTKE